MDVRVGKPLVEVEFLQGLLVSEKESSEGS
jgi:hypothetical protein